MMSASPAFIGMMGAKVLEALSTLIILHPDLKTTQQPVEFVTVFLLRFRIIDVSLSRPHQLYATRPAPGRVPRSRPTELPALSGLVLAGGGSLALRPWLEACFQRAAYAPDAAMANVEGFLRYGMRQMGGY